MRVCVCLHTQQGRCSCGATDSECFALHKSSEGTVTHGFWVPMNKTVSLVFLLDWPLLMAPGYSSSVLMWKAAATVRHNSCPLRPSHIKNRESLWPVFALSLSCWLSLPPLQPAARRHHRWESARLPQLGFCRRRESGGAGWRSNFSFSPSFTLILPPTPPRSIFCITALPPLIHQRKSPANFLNKQVCPLLLLNAHMHIGHTSLKLLGNTSNSNPHTHARTNTPRVAVYNRLNDSVLISEPWSRWQPTGAASLCV